MAPAARRAPSARRYHRAGRPGTERGAAAASCCGGSGGAESGEQIVTGAGRAGPRSGPACLLACLPARFSLPSPRGGAGGAARPARRVAMGAGGGHGRHCGAGRAGGCRAVPRPAVLCCAVLCCAVLLRVGAAPPPSRWLLTSIREICFNDLFVSRFPLGQRL